MISFQSIYNKLITEAVNVSDIRDAILNKNVVELTYDIGDGKATGTRVVEIHTVGLNVRGNAVLDAFQVRGDTKTLNNDWKTFDLKHIKTFKITDRTFDRPRPKWKETNNRKVVDVKLQVNFE
jgi:predicted DNA-binding transcriptional regulator YafY